MGDLILEVFQISTQSKDTEGLFQTKVDCVPTGRPEYTRRVSSTLRLARHGS